MFDRFFENSEESQRFFDKLSDAIVVIDKQGIVHSFNQAAQQLFGHSTNDVVGRNVSMLMPEHERHAHNGYLSARDAGSTDHVVGKIRSIQALKSDGSTFPAHIAISEFDTSEGVRFVGFVHDLSELVREQQQIAVENERLRIQHRVERAVQAYSTPEGLLRETLISLVSMSELKLQAKAGVFLVDVPSTRGSRSLEEPARSTNEPLGLRLAMLEGNFTEEFIEQEAWIPYGACLCGRAAEQGEVIMSTDCFSDCRHEHRFTGMTAHGHYIIPLHGKRGVIGVIFLYTDVDPHWNASMEQLMSTLGIMVGNALERLWAEQRSAGLINKLNLALLGSNAALVKIYFDAGEMVPVSGHLDTPHTKITSLKERMRCIPEPYHEAIRAARLNSEQVVVPFDLISRRYWLELLYTHEVIEHGNRVQYCLVRDITSEKEIQQTRDNLLIELSKRREQQERLYSVIGHEMKTPASALSMMIDAAPQSRLNEDMRLAMDNLLTVMGDMRQLTNPDAKVQLLNKPFNPQRLVGQIKEQLVGLYAKQQLNLHVESKLPKTLQLMGDAPRINMLLSNLLRNAALHSNGSNVRLSQRLLSSSKEGDVTLEWSVEDDGRGIPENDLERLLKPFERGDSKSEGTGLGLYIVNMICEALNAQLSYRRSELGGACFSVTATLSKVSTVEASLVDIPSSETFDGGERRVLLVEDDLTIRMLTKRMLTDLNFKVTTAENGVLGLNALGATLFDLVLSDYFMPKMNGDELIRAIRTEGMQMPIIGISASEADEEQAKMLAAGASSVIGKPLTKAKLIETIQTQIAI